MLQLTKKVLIYIKLQKKFDECDKDSKEQESKKEDEKICSYDPLNYDSLEKDIFNSFKFIALLSS